MDAFAKKGSSMKRVGIIAASGRSSRTGLSEYTTKAALPLLGRPLLMHQIDFLSRSGFDRIIVVCQPAHVKLLGSFLSDEERRLVVFHLAESNGGWAEKVERVLPFLDASDEVAIVPCDNYQPGAIGPCQFEYSASFSYTKATAAVSVTDGPVFGFCPGPKGWQEYPGRGFSGLLFTGYIVGRCVALRAALAKVGFSDRGEKEITAMLAVLQARGLLAAVPYPGEYVDIADLNALARLDAQLAHGVVDANPSIGAGVLLYSNFNGADRVLLTERQDGLGWVPPGGSVDSGESFAHAAARELREEVGIDVDESRLRLLGVYPTIGKNNNAACSVIYHCQIDCIPRESLDSREVRRAGWFARSEAEYLTVPFGLDRAVRDCFHKKELDCR